MYFLKGRYVPLFRTCWHVAIGSFSAAFGLLIQCNAVFLGKDWKLAIRSKSMRKSVKRKYRHLLRLYAEVIHLNLHLISIIAVLWDLTTSQTMPTWNGFSATCLFVKVWSPQSLMLILVLWSKYNLDQLINMLIWVCVICLY